VGLFLFSFLLVLHVVMAGLCGTERSEPSTTRISGLINRTSFPQQAPAKVDPKTEACFLASRSGTIEKETARGTTRQRGVEKKGCYSDILSIFYS
jgi:hypothetical protein